MIVCHLDSCHLQCRTYVRYRTCMTYDIVRATNDIVLYIVRAISYVRYTGYRRTTSYVRHRTSRTMSYVYIRHRTWHVRHRTWSPPHNCIHMPRDFARGISHGTSYAISYTISYTMSYTISYAMSYTVHRIRYRRYTRCRIRYHIYDIVYDIVYDVVCDILSYYH